MVGNDNLGVICDMRPMNLVRDGVFDIGLTAPAAIQWIRQPPFDAAGSRASIRAEPRSCRQPTRYDQGRSKRTAMAAEAITALSCFPSSGTSSPPFTALAVTIP